MAVNQRAASQRGRPVPDNGPAQAQVARPREEPRRENIAALAEELDNAHLAMVRAIAGYNTLIRTFNSSRGALQEGERAKGLLLTLIGSVNDSSPVDVEIDVLRDLTEVEVGYVLLPLARSQCVKAANEVHLLIVAAQRLQTIINNELNSQYFTAVGDDGTEAPQ